MGVRYHGIFTDSRNSSGTHRTYRVLFDFTGYAGSSSEVRMGNRAMVIDQVGSKEDLVGVVELRADFEITNGLAAVSSETFFTENEKSIRCTVQRMDPAGPFTPGSGTVLETIFVGYVTPRQSEDPYHDGAKTIRISATDGIAYLKNEKFITDGGYVLEGINTWLFVFKAVLDKIGLTLPFTTVGSLRRTGQDASGAFEPMAFTNHSLARYASMTYYEVLQIIATHWNARIVQHSGEWWMLRLYDLPEIVHYRKWAANGTYISGGTYDNNQTAAHNGPLQPLSGGVMSYDLSVKKLVANLKLGGYKNQLGDTKFEDIRPQPTTPPGLTDFGVWAKFYSPSVSRIGTGTSADPYKVKFLGYENKLQTDQPSIYQKISLGTGESAINNRISWKGIAECNDVKIIAMRILINITATGIPNSQFCLNDEGKWVRTSVGFIMYNHTDVNGKSKKSPLSWDITSDKISEIQLVDGSGVVIDQEDWLGVQVEITLCEGVGDPSSYWGGSPDRYVQYYDLQLGVVNEALNMNSTEVIYTLTNSAVSVKDEKLDLHFADMPDADQDSAMLDAAEAITTSNWITTGDTTEREIVEHLMRERLAIYSKPPRFFDGDIWGHVHPLKGVELAGETGLFVPLQVKYDYAAARATGRWIRLRQPNDAGGMTMAKSVKLRDGSEQPVTGVELPSTPDKTKVNDLIPDIWDFVNRIQFQKGLVLKKNVDDDEVQFLKWESATTTDVTDYINPTAVGFEMKTKDHFAAVFDVSALTAAANIKLPNVSTSAVMATDETAWMLGGNALTASKRIGSTTAWDVTLIANSVNKITLVSGGGVIVHSDSVFEDDAVFDGIVTLNSIAAATTDTDKFLVSDSGVVKYRTGTEILSDIGGFAAPSGLTTNYVTKWNGTSLANSSIFDNGTNVGIGTTSPSVLFDINGITRIRGALQMTPSQRIGSGLDFAHAGESGSGYLEFYNSGTGNTSLVNTTNFAAITFLTNNTERMRITASGSVGIGITPRAKLDVVGDFALLYNSEYPSATLPTTMAFGYESTGISFVTEYSQGTNSGKMAVIKHELVGAGNGHLHFETYAGGAGGGTRISILNTGNVGIGTTSPTYKLDVTGTGHFTGAVTFDTVPSSLQDATTSNHLVRYSQFIAATYLKPYIPVVKTVSFSSLTKSGLYAINGYTPTEGEYVLDASGGTGGGIWEVDASAWTRPVDANEDLELRGFIVSIQQGTYAGYKYLNTNISAITIGTTPITYSEWSNTVETDPFFTAWRDTTRSANTFWAAPNGSNGVTTWRALVAADIPTLNQSTTGSAATLGTSRSISLTGDATWSVGFNGSADVTSALTLATVSDSGTGTFLKITRNTKGLVTGTEAVITADITALLDAYTKVESDGRFVHLEGDEDIDGIKTFLTDIKVKGNQIHLTEDFLNRGGSASSYGVVSNKLGAGGLILDVTTTGGLYFRSNTTRKGLFDTNGLILSSSLGNNDVPTERLDVRGNIRYNTLLKPNNIGGTSGQFLGTSGTQDIWTTLTTSHISNLSAYTGFDSRYFTETEIIEGYQPLDADLTAIAALSGTIGFLKKTAANTWSLDTSTYLTSVSLTTNVTGILPIANGGTGSATQNFVDLTTNQTIAGVKTFSVDGYFSAVRIGTGGGNTPRSTVLGYDALNANTTGTNNTAIGYSSLLLNTTGHHNVGVGAHALRNNTTGRDNVGVGNFTLHNSTTGSYNVVVGSGGLYVNTSGSYNVALGLSSFEKNTTGSYNIAIGASAGSYLTNGITSNSTSANSVYIGYNTRSSIAAQTNQIVIGYEAIGNGSNTVTLGNSSIIGNYFNGTVKYGTLLKPNNVAGTNGQVLGTNGTQDSWVTLSTSYISDLNSYESFINYYTETEVDSLLSAKQATLPSGNSGQLLGKGVSGLQFLNLEINPLYLGHKRFAVGTEFDNFGEVDNLSWENDRQLRIGNYADSAMSLTVGFKPNDIDAVIEYQGLGDLYFKTTRDMYFENFAGGGNRMLAVSATGKVYATTIPSGGGGLGSSPLTADYIGFGGPDGILTGSNNMKWVDGRFLRIQDKTAGNRFLTFGINAGATEAIITSETTVAGALGLAIYAPSLKIDHLKGGGSVQMMTIDTDGYVGRQAIPSGGGGSVGNIDDVLATGSTAVNRTLNLNYTSAADRDAISIYAADEVKTSIFFKEAGTTAYGGKLTLEGGPGAGQPDPTTLRLHMINVGEDKGGLAIHRQTGNVYIGDSHASYNYDHGSTFLNKLFVDGGARLGKDAVPGTNNFITLNGTKFSLYLPSKGSIANNTDYKLRWASSDQAFYLVPM